jgi:hypothetical protein
MTNALLFSALSTASRLLRDERGDVLEQWRVAMPAGDEAEVAHLVERAHEQRGQFAARQ